MIHRGKYLSNCLRHTQRACLAVAVKIKRALAGTSKIPLRVGTDLFTVMEGLNTLVDICTKQDFCFTLFQGTLSKSII